MVTQKAPLGHIWNQLAKFAEVNMTTDLSHLPSGEVQAIKLLVSASRIIDELYLVQVSEDNPKLAQALAESREPGSHEYLQYFQIMFGPWDRRDHNKPFVNETAKPPGAHFYPSDMEPPEFEAWLESHPEDREAFESNFTVIRREDNGLVAIPYSVYYQDKLKILAGLLRQASEITQDLTLKTYLLSRADAFLSNDYYESDLDWLNLDGDIETVIGPYEVYEDGLLGYKAAFEAFVCTVDQSESKKLQRISLYLDEMEANLPIDNRYKNFERGSLSPFKVVNEIYAAGDAKADVQTLAFNLPNDERVRKAKGSKKVMLKNVMHSKFEKIFIPIANMALDPPEAQRISFEAYFNHILMHEVSHALGPGEITLNGESITVNKALKDLYSLIEECKADVLGLYNVQYLIDKGVFPASLGSSLYATYLGGMFRSIRFGISEAHGGGTAIQLNYLLDKDGFQINQAGLFSVNTRRIRHAVESLAGEVLMIQARGDYRAARTFIDKYCHLTPPVQAVLEKCQEIPVDIKPVYPIESETD